MEVIKVIWSQFLSGNVAWTPESNRERIALGPLLTTVLFLALKKTCFSKKKILPPQKIVFTFFLCNFSVRTLQCFQKILKFFWPRKSEKNWPQKLLMIDPAPFIAQSSQDHSPQPRIDFSYYEISGPDICSLICGGLPDTQSWFLKICWLEPNHYITGLKKM